MERSLKVYINPNFNQKPLMNTMLLPTQNNMHVNPYFSQVNLLSNFNQTVNLTTRRIFVNPNFIRPNNVFVPNSLESNLTYEPQETFNQKLVKNRSTNFDNCYKQNEVVQNVKQNPESKPSQAVSKSRYTLVRKNDVCSAKVDTITKKCTIKISKYKTARLSFIKNSLIEQESNKSEVKLQTTYRNQSSSKYNFIPKTAYQNPTLNRTYIKFNKTPATKKTVEAKPKFIKRMSPKAKKTFFGPSISLSRKTIPKRFKKNNIPCPLFTKYGKCLRDIRGNCEFLHDKKHVSICRKFLKGICHDPSCLLSHELSAKKMPTCYFYLNGNCTKINCPYLHVKLNNKTKVCNDFLKGYCENGDKCVYRHVNKQLKTTIEHNMNQQRRSTCSTSAIIVSNKVKLKPAQQTPEETSTPVSDAEREQDKDDLNCRYFKNNREDEQNQICDVIKPSRCKLGTLPSFIKL